MIKLIFILLVCLVILILIIIKMKEKIKELYGVGNIINFYYRVKNDN